MFIFYFNCHILNYMEKQNLLIHNTPTLYDILFELKHLVSFDIKKINNFEIENHNFKNTDLIISDKELELSNQISIDATPIQIGKLIDNINIKFLKKKIEFQKNIKISDYIINFNSRKMFNQNKTLSLTEKETLIISFLKNSGTSVSINELQKNVWGYRSKLETHTVETHVYRLRKKILKRFGDNNFIKSKKNGYKI
tara:strand:- start:499 stop:1089 length:591 start_codon:yes stop_codon:yes gene_type:complete